MSAKSVRFADPALQAGFTQIPNVILRDASLSAGARLTYAMLESFAWQGEECWPGQKKLGELVGVKERAIRNYLEELEAVNLLEVKQRGLQQSNVYTLFGADPDRHADAGPDRHEGADKEDTVEEDEEQPPPTPPRASVVKSKLTEEIDTVWATYVAVMKPRGRGVDLQPDDRKIIREALKVGDVDELETAIRTCEASDYHMKRGKHKKRPGGRHKSIGSILKPRATKGQTWRSRLEWWLEKADELEAGKKPEFDVNAEAARIRREQEAD